MWGVSGWASAYALAAWAGSASGQEAVAPPPSAAQPAASVAEVVVTADRAGLLERRRNDTVFGLDKALVDTPRSASVASDLTLSRYGVETVDDLVALSPGTFTASFFGVPGALNLRGTLAETYYRGFKRIENRGTYATPLGDASQVEIVRGPPTPVYGPGKVGGFLNITPKTSRDSGRFPTEVSGEASATYGSYDLKRASGEVGLPLRFGTVQGGLHLYLEGEDSDSFYRGIHPRRGTAQVAADFDFGDGWALAVGGQLFGSGGDVQTPGWNRLTQSLIDNGTYQTGRDTTLRDLDGNGRLTPNEIGATLATGYFGFPPATDPRYTLDTGVGTAKLDRRTVFVSDRDFSDTRTDTAYLDLTRDLGARQGIKLQLFYDDLSNDRFVSYGFPASYQSRAFEARASWRFDLERAFGGLVTAHNLVGASYRYVEARRRESYNSGYIALDRRDLVFGPTATDVFDDPFSTEPGGVGLSWETDINSRAHDGGLFFTSDVMIGPRLNLVLGGRYDLFHVSSRDDGTLVFGVPHTTFEDGQGKGTYSASVSYRLPFGLLPYATYAKAAALEVGQASDLPTNLVQGGGWLSDSELREVGVKFQLLNKTLVGALSAYRQNRTQLSGLASTVVGTRAKGVELEVRWLATKNVSLSFAGNLQRTTVKGPDRSFTYIPVFTAGVSGLQGYGGSYVVYDFSALPGRGGDYDLTLIPHAVASLYGTYTSDEHGWGRAGGTLGVTYTGRTSGTVANAVVYPSHAVVRASAFYARGPYTLELNVDNLLDETYFTPDADVYANLGALPGRGREWRVKATRRF